MVYEEVANSSAPKLANLPAPLTVFRTYFHPPFGALN